MTTMDELKKLSAAHDVNFTQMRKAIVTSVTPISATEAYYSAETTDGTIYQTLKGPKGAEVGSYVTVGMQDAGSAAGTTVKPKVIADAPVVVEKQATKLITILGNRPTPPPPVKQDNQDEEEQYPIIAYMAEYFFGGLAYTIDDNTGYVPNSYNRLRDSGLAYSLEVVENFIGLGACPSNSTVGTVSVSTSSNGGTIFTAGDGSFLRVGSLPYGLRFDTYDYENEGGKAATLSVVTAETPHGYDIVPSINARYYPEGTSITHGNGCVIAKVLLTYEGYTSFGRKYYKQATVEVEFMGWLGNGYRESTKQVRPDTFGWTGSPRYVWKGPDDLYLFQTGAPMGPFPSGYNSTPFPYPWINVAYSQVQPDPAGQSWGALWGAYGSITIIINNPYFHSTAGGPGEYSSISGDWYYVSMCNLLFFVYHTWVEKDSNGVITDTGSYYDFSY